MGNGASASTALSYASLTELRQFSDVAVEGVVRAATDDPAGDVVTVDMEIRQTLWSRGAQVGEAVRFVHERAGAPAVGEEAIVFLLRSEDGSYRASGGASGRFHVANDLVTPAASDGIRLPEGTDRAGFVALLEAPEPEPEPAPAPDYYGGGGSY